MAFSYSLLQQRFVETKDILFMLDTSAEYIRLVCASLFIGATVGLVVVQWQMWWFGLTFYTLVALQNVAMYFHMKFPITMGDDDDDGDGRSWVSEDTPLLLDDSSLPSTPLLLPLLATNGAV